MSLSPAQKERYKRQISLDEIGEQGQERICNGRVLIVGLGGLGSPVALYLAAAGTGTLGLVDGDTVDTSNLQRQIIHFDTDKGRKKVESAAEKIAKVNPEVKVNTIASYLDSDTFEKIVNDYDFVIEATDNMQSKLLINDGCVRAGIPFVHAGIHQFGGEIMTVIPGCSACYRCVCNYEMNTNVKAAPTVPLGPLGPIAGAIGTLQAVECLKYLAGTEGLLTNRLLLVNCLDFSFRTIKVQRKESCPACGSSFNH
jgi:molybdopterin/thiamine biosynthesis adenylyltransferase